MPTIMNIILGLKPGEEFRPNFLPDGVEEEEVGEDLDDAAAKYEADSEALMVAALAGTDLSKEELKAVHQTLGALVLENVVNPATLKGHQTWLAGFDKYLVLQPGNISPTRPSLPLLKQMMEYIALKCAPKDMGGQGQAYLTAQAIRAAYTWHFCQLNPQNPDKGFDWDPITLFGTGNPSREAVMSSFMLALSKLEARAGESFTHRFPQSMRAITRVDLSALHEHLVVRAASGKAGIQYTVFVITFLCCMRMDEPLSLKLCHSEYDLNKPSVVVIRLATRKTHQSGGIHPFHLHRNDFDKVLCPVRAMMRWFKAADTSTPGKAWLTMNSPPFFFEIDKNGNRSPDHRVGVHSVNTWLRAALCAIHF